MGKLKIVLIVVLMSIIGLGLFFMVFTYAPQLISWFSPQKQSIEEVVPVDPFFSQFPDSNLVMEIDFSSDNASIVNYGIIRERYPFLPAVDSLVPRIVGKSDVPVVPSLPITWEQLWNTFGKTFFIAVEFQENEEGTVTPNYTLHTTYVSETLIKSLLQAQESQKYVQQLDENYYKLITNENTESARTFYLLLKDNVLWVSTHELPLTLKTTLASNPAFTRLWNSLPEQSFFKVYGDKSVISSLSKIYKEESLSKYTGYIKEFGISATIAPDEIYFTEISTEPDSQVLNYPELTNSTFDILKLLPKQTVFFTAFGKVNKLYPVYKDLLDTLDANLQVQGTTDEISSYLDGFESYTGINIEEFFDSLFTKDSIFAISEIDNVMIPVAGMLITETDPSQPELTKSVIQKFEDGVISIVKDDIFKDKVTMDLSFVDDENEYFSFRKFVPNPKFPLGIYHTDQLSEGTWVVTSSRFALTDIYNTLHALSEGIQANTRYQNILSRVKSDSYISFTFVDLYRIYRLIQPFIGASMGDSEFEKFEENYNPYLEKMHSLYSQSYRIDDDTLMEKTGFVFE